MLWSNDATGALNDFIMPDMMMAMASFAFVFLYVMFNLSSLFLAICGMFEIVISLPLAFFVWKVERLAALPPRARLLCRRAAERAPFEPPRAQLHVLQHS